MDIHIHGKPVNVSPLLIFTRESSYCFQRVLAIAILSVCLFVCLFVTRADQSKTAQAIGHQVFAIGCRLLFREP